MNRVVHRIRRAFFAALVLSFGCESSGRVEPAVTEANPLFTAIYFEGTNGTVIEPSPAASSRLLADTALDFVGSSVSNLDVVARVVDGENSASDAGVSDGGVGTSIPVAVLSVTARPGSGTANGIAVVLDWSVISTHPGKQLEVRINPANWTFASPLPAELQRRLTVRFRIGLAPRDGDPPFVSTATSSATWSTEGFAIRMDANQPEAIIAPHSKLALGFSETMATLSTSSVPDDPIAYVPELTLVGDGPFFDGYAIATRAGFVPDTRYCLEIVPPIAAGGPLLFGTQDATGMPLVPPYPTQAERTAAVGSGEATEACFTTGPSRIESPYPGRLVGAATGRFQLKYADSQTVAPGCSVRAAFRATVTPATALAAPSTVRAAVPAQSAATVVQGEISKPVMLGTYSAVVSAGLIQACIDSGHGDDCAASVQIDACDACSSGEQCRPADIVNVVLDVVPPPAVTSDAISIDDWDSADSVLEQICVTLPTLAPTDSISVEITVPTETITHEVLVSDPRVVVHRIDSTRSRYCIAGLASVAHRDDATNAWTPIHISVWLTDEAGNAGGSGSTAADCRLPPQKGVGRQGRLMASTVSSSGVVSVLTGRAADAGRVSPDSFALSRLDPASGTWVESRTDCLCGASNGRCLSCDADRRVGGRIDATMNAADELIACYTLGRQYTAGESWTHVPSELHLLVRTVQGTWSDSILRSDVVNAGCAIEARSSNSPGRSPYVVGFMREITQTVGTLSSTGPAATFDLVDDTGASSPTRSVSIGSTFFEEPNISLGFDVAIDDVGRFWAIDTRVLSADGIRIIGEDGTNLLGQHEDDGQMVLINEFSFSPRLAANGDGNVAAVFSRLGQLVLARRRPGGTAIETGPILASDVTVSAFQSDPAVPVRGEAMNGEYTHRPLTYPNVDSFFVHAGIVADIELPRTSSDPIVSWIANSPGGIDYHALMLARPSLRAPGRFDYEVLDGRVEQSGSIDLSLSAADKVRVAYHNGLRSAGAGDHLPSPPGFADGLTNFIREEDESEISRDPGRDRRLAATCFANRRFTHGDMPGGPLAYGPTSGVSDADIGMVVRPSLDIDPFGRTLDPKLGDEISSRFTDRAGRVTPFFARVSGESTSDWIFRTNRLRSSAFFELKDLLGSVSFLDSAALNQLFKRPDEMGTWTLFVPPTDLDPNHGSAIDPFYATILETGEVRNGLLDPLFGLLDEFGDDMCGLHANPASPTESVTRTPDACPDPGAIEVNPNPYFPGEYFASDLASLPRPLSELSSSPTRERDAFERFRDGVEGTPRGDSVGLPALTAFEQPGLVRMVLRGLRITSSTVGTRTTHQCSANNCEASFGAPALPLTAEEAAVLRAQGGSGPVPPRLAGPSSGLQTGGKCPSWRRGARGAPVSEDLLAQVSLDDVPPLGALAGSSDSICCDGYEVRRCDDDSDCPIDFCNAPPRHPGPITRTAACGPAEPGERGVCQTTAGLPLCFSSDAHSVSAVCRDEPHTPIRTAETCPPGDPDCTLFDIPGAWESNASRASSIMTQVVGQACGPGTSCDTRANRSSGTTGGRPVLGHYLLSIAGPALLGSGGNGAFNNLISGLNRLTSDLNPHLPSQLETNIEIDEVRLQWIGRNDGGLVLQGYLELTIRFRNPAITLDGPLWHNVSTSPARIRIRLQPFFDNRTGPGNQIQCDSCGRPQSPRSIRFALVSAKLIADTDDVERGVSVSGCTRVTNFFLGACGGVAIGDVQVGSTDDLDDALSSMLAGAVAANLNTFDDLFALAALDPTVGGMLLGRGPAVDSIVDPVECRPGVSRVSVGGCNSSPQYVVRADTVEAVHVHSGVASLVGRDNP